MSELAQGNCTMYSWRRAEGGEPDAFDWLVQAILDAPPEAVRIAFGIEDAEEARDRQAERVEHAVRRVAAQGAPVPRVQVEERDYELTKEAVAAAFPNEDTTGWVLIEHGEWRSPEGQWDRKRAREGRERG